MLAKTGVHHYSGSEYILPFALEPSRAMSRESPAASKASETASRRPRARVSGVPSPPGF